mmetsp:Transcript_42329/g.110205  ORF Transcript_42329/g.110205 Transcript_42329/m.110205 type:complete len:214 (-) Transcript_42329:228-869(-)
MVLEGRQPARRAGPHATYMLYLGSTCTAGLARPRAEPGGTSGLSGLPGPMPSPRFRGAAFRSPKVRNPSMESAMPDRGWPVQIDGSCRTLLSSSLPGARVKRRLLLIVLNCRGVCGGGAPGGGWGAAVWTSVSVTCCCASSISSVRRTTSSDGSRHWSKRQKLVRPKWPCFSKASFASRRCRPTQRAHRSEEPAGQCTKHEHQPSRAPEQPEG